MELAIEDALRPFGLSMTDVEDVLPMQDFAMVMSRRLRPQSWNHRHVYVFNEATTDQVYSAWRQMMCSYPMLRSFVMDVDGVPSYVTLSPSDQLLRTMVSTHPAVASHEDFLSLLWNDEQHDFASTPGPMCKIVVAGVTEGNTAGYLLNVSHAVFDMHTMGYWLHDIKAMIEDGQPPRGPKAPYKPWANAYAAHRKGVTARRNCQYHADRLKGIGRLGSTLWPPARAPEMFKGNDRDWSHTDGTRGSNSERIPLDGDAKQGVTGVTRHRKLPGLVLLGLKYGIKPPSILKAACALLNMTLTKSDQALFASYQSARTWPFVQDWTSESERKELPPIAAVSGPTLEITINRLAVRNGETVGDFLNGVQNEQRFLSKHAQAPFFVLQEMLREQGSATEGDADAFMLHETVRRQIFNWLGDVVGGSRYGSMNQIQRVSRSDVGILWNCGVAHGADEQTVTLNATFDDAQLRMRDVSAATDKMLDIAARLADPDNWNSPVNRLLR